MKKTTISIDALPSVSSISEMKEVAREEVKTSFESLKTSTVVKPTARVTQVPDRPIDLHLKRRA